MHRVRSDGAGAAARRGDGDPRAPASRGRGAQRRPFTPGRADAALPVLVWIHGGRRRRWLTWRAWYDGFAFNRDGIVTVTISHRLGFDGFWVDPGRALHRGLLDQIAALEWVWD